MTQRRPNPLKVTRDVERVQARMENLAKRSSAKSVEVMREGAEKVMKQARDFTPMESGALGDKDNWEIDEQSDGVNRRLTYTVRIKPGAMNAERGLPVSRYAAVMHDSHYNLGEGSKYKARMLGLSQFPIGSRKFVGRMYLQRAAANHRLKIEENLKREIGRILR